MAGKFQIRRGLAANWTATNPTLAQGEFGYEIDTGRIKIGDGITAWNSLGYKFETASFEYFQASQTVANAGVGVAPVNVNLTQNQNSDGAIFSLAANVLTINKTGTFEFSVQVTADTNTGSREQSHIQLERNNLAIPNTEGHTEAYAYHRNNPTGNGTANIEVILDVTSGDTFRVRIDSPTVSVNTVPNGTGLKVREI